MSSYTADFETTTDEKDCRVWAYALCEIGNTNNLIIGNNIKDFMKFCSNSKHNDVLYFHNLKFDGEYIISYLLKNEFTHIKEKSERADKTFTTLISGMGQFYSIEIYFKVAPKKVNKVTIYDSLKILNFSVDQIAKDFDLPIRKLELDYTAKREIGHVLTEHEIDYITNDVKIMAQALSIMFTAGLTKMTIGSDALHNYKKMCSSFNKYFPILPNEIDSDIRKSYRGGFTYLNPLYKGKESTKGYVLDVNSLYPSVMVNEKLPFGEPVFFEGKYEEDKLYPLYIQHLSCSFEIKEGMIPTIQIKNHLSFIPNEYLESSDGKIIDLVLTSIDLELFLKHYNIYDETWNNGWKFKGVKGLFTDYIEYWTSQKIKAKKDKNSSMYRISKLMLNSLYGKMGLNPLVRSKFPYLDDEGIVRYGFFPEEERKPIYIPVASFITSYARKKTIESSQAIREYSKWRYEEDYYIYSDTDSIHLKYIDPEELANIIEIDDYKLGAWKVESEFIRGKYLRQKCYIEESPTGEMNVTVAGLPKKLSKLVNFDNFEEGFTTEGMEGEKKLTYKHVKGGVLLVETEFTIK